MQLLVTGGAGFIGSNFIRYWLEKYPSDTIVNFDALTYAGNLANLADIAENTRYRFVRGNITDAQAVRDAMHGSDAVVHFAAESHVDRSIMGPAAFVSTNVVGTQVLLDAARELHVQRFHHVSTDEVFGSLPVQGEEKFTEATPYNPHSPYSASKASSDFLVRAYHDTFGLPVTISNCTNNYGPYQFPEKLIPLVTLRALDNRPVPVYGTGENVRDWIHVLDHCYAVDLILHGGRVGETYGAGGHAEMQNLQIVKMILGILGKPESLIDFVTDRAGHDLRYAIDDSKIGSELGYAPKHTFEQGLEATVRWYADHKEWWAPIISGEYQTYYQEQYGNR